MIGRFQQRPPAGPQSGQPPGQQPGHQSRQPGLVDPSLVMPLAAAPAPPEVGPSPGAGSGSGFAAAFGMAPHGPDASVSADARATAERVNRAVTTSTSRWGRAFWLLIALMAAFLAYDTISGLVDIWGRDPIGGGLLTLLSLAFLTALGAAVSAELRTIRRLRDVARFRRDLETALERDSARRLSSALAPMLAMVHERHPELVRDFRHRVQGQTECATIIKHFRGAVLTPLDQEARRAVRSNAMAVLGATAISPHPALDVAIVIWRGIVMVRKVAEIYGLRPSGLTTLHLTRSVIVSAALAMAADPAGDVVANTLGGSLAEKVSARFAEGSISGLRALRLGVRAIDVCRPLPFEPDERKGMLHTLMQG